MDDTRDLFMNADEYDACYDAVKQMEQELNIKFNDSEFDKMMLMIYDPSFTINPED